MKYFKNKILEEKNNKEITSRVRGKLNYIFDNLSRGMTYEDLVAHCKDMTEDEINAALWYFAKKGLKYVPSIS